MRGEMRGFGERGQLALTKGGGRGGERRATEGSGEERRGAERRGYGEGGRLALTEDVLALLLQLGLDDLLRALAAGLRREVHHDRHKVRLFTDVIQQALGDHRLARQDKTRWRSIAAGQVNRTAILQEQLKKR